MTKWTTDTERLFDELVAGLPEGAQNMVKDYAIDAAEFQPMEEAIAEGALTATHGYHEIEKPEEELAWTHDAVYELIREIQTSHWSMTAEETKITLEACEMTARMNGNDLVEASDVHETHEGCPR